jgi:hypothetical protein
MKNSTCIEIVRLYQSFVLDIVVERASGFDDEIVELAQEMAIDLGISVEQSAALLHRPYRAALDALSEVRA